MKKTIISGEVKYYFDSRFFEVDGKSYEIIGTKADGYKSEDTTHVVKNLATGNSRDVKMKELINIFRKHKLIE